MSKPERHAAGGAAASPKRGAPPKGAPKSARAPPHGAAKGDRSFVAKKGGASGGGGGGGGKSGGGGGGGGTKRPSGDHHHHHASPRIPPAPPADRKERKQLSEQRKLATKKHYGTIAETVRLWEAARPRAADAAQRRKLAEDVARRFAGKAPELAAHHSASRVLQFALKELPAGGKARAALVAEVREHALALARSKYGKHVVQRLIAHAQRGGSGGGGAEGKAELEGEFFLCFFVGACARGGRQGGRGAAKAPLVPRQRWQTRQILRYLTEPGGRAPSFSARAPALRRKQLMSLRRGGAPSLPSLCHILGPWRETCARSSLKTPMRAHGHGRAQSRTTTGATSHRGALFLPAAPTVLYL
jgi:hypothetical protein